MSNAGGLQGALSGAPYCFNAGDDEPRMFRVTVLPSGETFEANADQTMLNAALAAGVRLAKLCRNGTCRTCRCKLLRGKADHTIDWPGLSREEKAEGWVLPCVLRAFSDCVLDTSTI